MIVLIQKFSIYSQKILFKLNDCISSHLNQSIINDYGKFINLLVYTHPLFVYRIKRAKETDREIMNSKKNLIKYWPQIKLILWEPFIDTINEKFVSMSKIILKHPHHAVIVFSIIGLFLSFYYELTMDDDAWFWFFSSIAQTLAALIALIAIFLISRVESYNLQINNKYKQLHEIINDIITDKESKYFAASNELIKSDSEILKLSLDPRESVLWINAMNEISNIEQKKEIFNENFREIFGYALGIIVVSIIVLPLGSVDTEKLSTLNIWNDLKLKWFTIYLVVGYCIVIIYQIAHGLSDFFRHD